MSISEFLDMCIDPGLMNVEIYDMISGSTVWSGFGDELPDEFWDVTVETYDVPRDGQMTLNVELDQ